MRWTWPSCALSNWSYPTWPNPLSCLLRWALASHCHCHLSSLQQLSQSPLRGESWVPSFLHPHDGTACWCDHSSSSTHVLPDQIHRDYGYPNSCPKRPGNTIWKSENFKRMGWILANKQEIKSHWYMDPCCLSGDVPWDEHSLSLWSSGQIDNTPALYLLNLLLCFISLLPHWDSIANKALTYKTKEKKITCPKACG